MELSMMSGTIVHLKNNETEQPIRERAPSDAANHRTRSRTQRCDDGG